MASGKTGVPVSFDRIHKSFGPVRVLEELNLQVEPGEFLVLLGASGSGKTTALRILSGLETATAGRVLIGNRDVTDILMESAPRGMDLAALRNSMLGQGGVSAIHDLHVWTLGAGQVYLSAHVVTLASTDRDAVLKTLNASLREDFGVAHTTLQIEGEGMGTTADPCDPCDSPAS